MNILPGAFSVFGGLAQGAFNTMSNYSSNNTNKEAIEMSNRFNREMWELEKEYNSPLAQMKRLQQAGINPAFAYSNGVSNTVSSAPTATPPIANQPYLGNELAEIGNRLSLDTLRDIQGDESRSKTRLNDHTILVQDSEISKNSAAVKEMSKNCEYLSSLILKNESTIRNLDSLTAINDEKKRLLEIERWIKEATKHDEVLAKQLANKETEENIKLIIQKVVESKSQVKVNNSQAELNNDLSYKALADVRECFKRISKMNHEEALMQFDLMLKQETKDEMIQLLGFEVANGQLSVDISQIQKELLEIEKSWKQLDHDLNNNVIYSLLSRLVGLVGQVMKFDINFSRSTNTNTSTSTNTSTVTHNR